jgi:predicted type IV restriction endonuclease
MSFHDQIRALAARLSSILENTATEEATKHFLIMPFIQALGYNVFDHQEVVPEFDANVGTSTKYKLDYAILKDGKPVILIECKSAKDKLTGTDGWSQLFHYFVATDARIGILTNGIVYRFYSDLDKPNKMDDKPFLEIDLLNLKDSLVEELRRITKDTFDREEVVSAAADLKYVGGIVEILAEQAVEPTEEFTRFFFGQLSPGKQFSPSAKTQFSDYTKRAFRHFIKEQFSKVLEQTDVEPLHHSSEPVLGSTNGETADEADGKIITTEEELQGFYIVKAILTGTVDLSRVVYRDVQSYFGILLDDNNRKPVCRLYFNNLTSLKIVLFDHGDGEKQSERISIESLDRIYDYADRIRATVLHYENKKSIGTVSQENPTQELAGVSG